MKARFTIAKEERKIISECKIGDIIEYDNRIYINLGFYDANKYQILEIVNEKDISIRLIADNQYVDISKKEIIISN